MTPARPASRVASALFAVTAVLFAIGVAAESEGDREGAGSQIEASEEHSESGEAEVHGDNAAAEEQAGEAGRHDESG